MVYQTMSAKQQTELSVIVFNASWLMLLTIIFHQYQWPSACAHRGFLRRAKAPSCAAIAARALAHISVNNPASSRRFSMQAKIDGINGGGRRRHRGGAGERSGVASARHHQQREHQRHQAKTRRVIKQRQRSNNYRRPARSIRRKRMKNGVKLKGGKSALTIGRISAVYRRRKADIKKRQKVATIEHGEDENLQRQRGISQNKASLKYRQNIAAYKDFARGKREKLSASRRGISNSNRGAIEQR